MSTNLSAVLTPLHPLHLSQNILRHRLTPSSSQTMARRFQSTTTRLSSSNVLLPELSAPSSLSARSTTKPQSLGGGGIQEGVKAVPDHYCAPGEVCGDPVSQLHKIALEIYEPNWPPAEPGTPGAFGAFLSCIAEKVNTYRPVEGKQWSPILTLPLPARGSDSPAMPGSPVTSTPSPANTVHPFGSLDVPLSSMETEGTNDGGLVKKRKRATSSTGGASESSQMKGRTKRPHSAGPGSTKRPSAADSITHLGRSGALWQVDVGETSVWTIVGTGELALGSGGHSHD